jgi:uncharacterized small protein (DUF1192 family)
VGKPCRYCGATEHAERVAERDLRLAALEAEVERLESEKRDWSRLLVDLGFDGETTASAVKASLDHYRQCEEDCAALEAEVERLREERDRAIHDGKLRRCDLPACNCNGYHSHYAQRMLEIAGECDELRALLREVLALLDDIEWFGETPIQDRIRIALGEEVE